MLDNPRGRQTDPGNVERQTTNKHVNKKQRASGTGNQSGEDRLWMMSAVVFCVFAGAPRDDSFVFRGGRQIGEERKKEGTRCHLDPGSSMLEWARKERCTGRDRREEGAQGGGEGREREPGGGTSRGKGEVGCEGGRGWRGACLFTAIRMAGT
ncbi:hypothetical protein DPEC_G00079210 [Dallia pectoralis]|uniref:Uncharacterized protein n=1 Tax=Dallia pectoralis TaxID=75939 RepID=A0ACC2H4J0_DALPE|nr:hypothetical protein DPEC_G00079210 [Dallia pectoralis]